MSDAIKVAVAKDMDRVIEMTTALENRKVEIAAAGPGELGVPLGEILANMTLAIRHLEDAEARLQRVWLKIKL